MSAAQGRAATRSGTRAFTGGRRTPTGPGENYLASAVLRRRGTVALMAGPLDFLTYTATSSQARRRMVIS
jgi:hypothetical protein